MSGHGANSSPNAHGLNHAHAETHFSGSGAGAGRGNGNGNGADGIDAAAHANSKRLRDGPSWEGSIKRLRRDDLDQQQQQQQAQDSSTSHYASPTTAYDVSAAAVAVAHGRAYPQQQSATPTPYPSNTPATSYVHQGSTFSDVPQPSANIDAVAFSPYARQAYREQDPAAAFGAFTPNQANQPYASHWGMPPQQDARVGAPYQSLDDSLEQDQEQDAYYDPSVPYSQADPAPPPAPPSDWSHSSHHVNSNNIFDAWNYQIDEPCVYGDDATLHLKLQSLSTLDNLSTQIILNLSKGSLNDIMLLTAGRDYEESQAYFTRRTLFDQTRKVFTRNTVFIDHNETQRLTASQQEVIRKVNRATFISSILEGHDISFFDLDARFLETFVSPGQRLLKWQGTIFLELKTQAYIAALMNNDGPPDALLAELFPQDLEARIIARHPDAASLAPSELEFLQRAGARKQYLANEPAYQALSVLPKKYGWHDFLREFASSISKNVEHLVNNPARTPSSIGAAFASPSFMAARLSQSPATRHPNYHSPRLAPPIPSAYPTSAPHSFGGPSASTDDVQTPQTPHMQQMSAAQRGMSESHLESATPEGVDTPDSARAKGKAKAAKASGSGTPRQPWKAEEEEALMAGLNEVKGPHWSQILSLYGRGGSVSEVLKDRNQIQLKDKARNLKLWYLKMGNELPSCLRGVTGELRKRGGARIRAAMGLNDDDGEGSARKGSPKVGGSGASRGTPLRNVQSGQTDVSSATPQIDPALDG